MSLTKVSYSMINGGPLSVKDMGAVGDYSRATEVGTDDTAAFQLAATKCDVEGYTSLYIPNGIENYLISAPIAFSEPGVRIFGTGGPGGADRGIPLKNGQVVVAPGTTHAFDLGASRTGGNAADNWTIENIAVSPKVPDYVADAIRFTSRTDGPDRGAIVRECSAVQMNTGISIPARGVGTALATLVAENNFFCRNNYGIFANGGNVYGARIVGNQLEQNLGGGIWGSFNAHVYIADNMLEGQNNAIYLTVPELVGGLTSSIVIERNYFEGNTGAFVIKIVAIVDTAVTIRDNFWFSSASTDQIVITGYGGCLLNVQEQVYNPVPVTFDEFTGVINYGSDFLNNVSEFFYVRRFTDNLGCPLIALENYENFVYPLSPTLVDSPETGVGHIDTPYGNMACANYNEDTLVPLAVDVQEVISLSIFCKIDRTAKFEIQVWNSALTGILQKWTSITVNPVDMNGRWGLVVMPFLSSGVASGLKIRVVPLTGNIGNFLIAGISAENLGVHANDGVDIVSITPRMPNRVVTQIGSNYSVSSISSTTAIVDTNINPIKNMMDINEISCMYDIVVTGQTDAASNSDSSIAYGVITVFNTGTSFTMAYTQQGAVGDNPLTVTAVFWNGTTETSTAAIGANIEMRIKVAGYLNNTGYEQSCKLIRRI